MKKVLVFLLLMSCVGAADKDPEVRAYRVDLKEIWVFELKNEGGDIEKGEVFKAGEVKEPSFQSRFFTKGGGFLNYTVWGKEAGLFREGKDQAIYDVKSGRLVVRTDLWRHRFIEDLLGHSLVTQTRLNLKVRKLAKVTLARPKLTQDTWGELGNKVFSISGIAAVSGQTMQVSAGGGKITMEAGCFFDETGWDCRLYLESEIPGAWIDLRTELVGALGLPTFFELGSVDGKSTLVASLTVTKVLADGSDFDEWVRSEDGTNRVMKDRIHRLHNADKDYVDLGNGRAYQVFVVPPTFWTFLSGGEENKQTVRAVFAENGVKLAAEDCVFRLPDRLRFAVEAEMRTIRLIDDLTMAAGITDPPPVMSGSFSLVESKRKLTRADVEAGRFAILKKLAPTGSPGGSIYLSLEKSRRRIDLEINTDGDDGFVTTHFQFGQEKAPGWKGSVDAAVDTPVIFQQVKVGDRWQSRVAVFSAQWIDDTIRDGR